MRQNLGRDGETRISDIRILHHSSVTTHVPFSSHYHLVQRHMLTRISGLSSLQAYFVISVAINKGQPNIDRRSATAFGQQMSRHNRKLTSSTIEFTEADIAAPAVKSSLPPGQ